MTGVLIALAQLGNPRILVVGDVILDRYTWGETERVSPEAPVLVLNADEDEIRPGGAASVAALLRGLDAEVLLASVVGDDPDGRTLVGIVSETGTNCDLMRTDPGRPTTSKHRFLGRSGGRQPQQMLRVDREVRTALPREIEAPWRDDVLNAIAGCDAVLISDYAKGICAPTLLKPVIQRCRARQCPILIDPGRITDYSIYREADLLKPNRIELQTATGKLVASAEHAVRLGQQLCRDLSVGAIAVTLDCEGTVLVQRNGSAEVVPTVPQMARDVTGAGDMMFAMLGLCVASQCPLPTSVRLANVAAGLEIQKLGISTVTRSEIATVLDCRSSTVKQITLESLLSLVEEYRTRGQRIVFTNGCFDLLHVGHIKFLEEAARMGDMLVVGVNSDASVRRLKGPSRPVIPERDRAATVAALACVRHVLLFDEDTPCAVLRVLRPDVLVKGGGYSPEQVVGREIVESAGGSVHVIRRVCQNSSTGIVNRIRAVTVTSVCE